MTLKRQCFALISYITLIIILVSPHPLTHCAGKQEEPNSSDLTTTRYEKIRHDVKEFCGQHKKELLIFGSIMAAVGAVALYGLYPSKQASPPESVPERRPGSPILPPQQETSQEQKDELKAFSEMVDMQANEWKRLEKMKQIETQIREAKTNNELKTLVLALQEIATDQEWERFTTNTEPRLSRIGFNSGRLNRQKTPTRGGGITVEEVKKEGLTTPERAPTRCATAPSRDENTSVQEAEQPSWRENTISPTKELDLLEKKLTARDKSIEEFQKILTQDADPKKVINAKNSITLFEQQKSNIQARINVLKAQIAQKNQTGPT